MLKMLKKFMTYKLIGTDTPGIISQICALHNKYHRLKRNTEHRGMKFIATEMNIIVKYFQ